MSDMAELARAIIGGGTQPRSSEHLATVLRQGSDGTYWVHIPGGADETPISTHMAEASEGDTVRVSISGGKTVMLGNVTSPSATVRTVGEVSEKAQSAYDAAESAYASAEEAAAAAGWAQSSAESAYQSAQSALADAYSAQESARNAGSGLAEVENIVGTLNWLTQHGSFVLTADEAPQDGKVYYTLDGGNYALTTDTELAEHKQYYVLDDGEYVPVTSPDVADIATYYERSEMTVNKVTEPKAEDIGTYFESWIGESLQNYIASHLWLDDYGLNLTVDTGSGYRLHEGTVDGSHQMGMYILDALGNTVSSFGETVQIGPDAKAHVSISGNRLSFMDEGFEVAYAAIDEESNESVFYMTKAIVTQDLRFADWQWRSRSNGNLSLKWVGGGAS